MFFRYCEDLAVEPMWREVFNRSFIPDMIAEQLEGFSCISQSFKHREMRFLSQQDVPTKLVFRTALLLQILIFI